MTIPIPAPRWLTPVTAAFAGSLLLSLVARLGSTINRDGMLYINTAQAFLDGQSWPAAVNIGIAPTIRQEDLTIEAFLIGFHGERFKFGYSYDVTTSKLTTATAGSHEVSLTLQFNCKKKRRRVRTVPCPTF